jgi:hypothetical protein
MAYSEETVQRVWEKARAMPERDPLEWRQDECGAWIQRPQYGSGSAEFGWKIENVSPGHPDEPENLRPFHRDNAFDRALGKSRCHVVADRDNIPPTAQVGTPRNKSLD